MQLIIDTKDTSISVRNKCFYIQNKAMQKQISPKRISSIAILSNCNLNTAVVKLAAQQQVPILFFNSFGTIQAKMWSPYFTNLARLRKKQLYFVETELATQWVVGLFERKTNEQLLNLQRLAKSRPRYKKEVTNIQKTILETFAKMKALQQYKMGKVRNSIMGFEGIISRYYFQCLNHFLPADFQFEKRSRRPAADYFNAGLNYLYGMTYSIVEGGVFAKGLDPSAGCLHVDSYSQPTLVFDLIEPIRPLVDRILIELILTGQLNPEHFIEKEQGYWVNKKGKRIIIKSFNRFLHQRVSFNGSIRRFKDHIYEESNRLGQMIEQNIELL